MMLLALGLGRGPPPPPSSPPPPCRRGASFIAGKPTPNRPCPPPSRGCLAGAEQHHQVGDLRAVNWCSRAAQHVGHALRIIDVHLTAVGLDEQTLGGLGHGVGYGRRRASGEQQLSALRSARSTARAGVDQLEAQALGDGLLQGLDLVVDDSMTLPLHACRSGDRGDGWASLHSASSRRGNRRRSMIHAPRTAAPCGRRSGDQEYAGRPRRAPIQLLDVGMVLGERQHAGHDPALVGHAHALFGADFLDTVQTVLTALQVKDRRKGPHC